MLILIIHIILVLEKRKILLLLIYQLIFKTNLYKLFRFHVKKFSLTLKHTEIKFMI